MLKFNMKRFLSAIFVILLLCQNISTSQAQTNEGSESNPPAPIVSEEKNTTDKNPEPHQEQTSVEKEDAIGEQDIPVVERVRKLTQRANWALIISAGASVFAGLTWLSGIRGLKASNIVSKIESRAYVEIDRVIYGHPAMKEKMIFEGSVKNGKAFSQFRIVAAHKKGFPAHDIKITGEVRLFDGGFSDKIEDAGFVPVKHEIGYIGIGSEYQFPFSSREIPVRESIRAQSTKMVAIVNGEKVEPWKSDELYIEIKLILSYIDDYAIKNKLPRTEIKSTFYGPCIHTIELHRGETYQEVEELEREKFT